jgi:p-hydroxybenzoate 3-monooxygenase
MGLQTKVGIIGAGPAGLLLSHLLHLEGIESVVLEARSRDYVEQRVRAGVLEQGTVDLLLDKGLGDRLGREALVHHGIELRFDGRGHRIALSDLTGGRAIWIYGQQEVVKDLIETRLAAGATIHFEVAEVKPADLNTTHPVISYRKDGRNHELTCDFVAGCDGFHGVSRDAIPSGVLRTYQHTYPFGWLGILAAVAPSTDELIYAYHDRGFALHSLRSEGPVLEKGITPMRSFVVAPMQYGRLFLAGDAAHIVPATGAKGLNLAVHDVRILAEALTAWYHAGTDELLERYSDMCLRRAWRVQDFSAFMSLMLHRYSDDDGFRGRLQRAQLEYVCSSDAAARSLAENYVGLPHV